MLVNERSKKEKAKKRRASADGADGDFDRWLDRQMHELYDDAMNETIPDDLMRLLEKFESRERRAGDEADHMQAKSDERRKRPRRGS